MPPVGSRALPCLHYFLGAAETESERADEYEALLKLARGTPQESAVREEIVRQRLRAMKQGVESAQPSDRPQPASSEAPLRESEESLRRQIAQMARAMEELRRSNSAPPRPKPAPPRPQASPDNTLLWGGAALAGLLMYLRKNQAPAVPTTPQGEKPPTPPEAVVFEPGLETILESEIHEQKRVAEQNPASQTAPAAPAESLPTAEAQPNPPESTEHPWTGPPQTQARVPTNEDQAIAALSDELLRLFRLQGPHAPPKA